MPTPTYNFVTPEKGKLVTRDIFKEGQTSTEALKTLQPQILEMYKNLYNEFYPASLEKYGEDLARSVGDDWQALQNAKLGILSAEEARNAQQAAREAWSARGLVHSKGAIGDEVLRRDAMVKQNEELARQHYQQSMGNLETMVGMETGDIFKPIASLMANTFNPYSQYGNEVYDYNANAYNAWQIAQANRESALEAAKMGKQADYIQALGSFLSNNGIQMTQDSLKSLFDLVVKGGSWLGGALTPNP